MLLEDNIDNRGILVGAPAVGVVLKVKINEIPFEELAEKFEPLLKKQIRQLGLSNQFDEYYQVGLIALWEASLKFDDTKGYFPSFAQKYVKGKMLNHLNSEKRLQPHYLGNLNTELVENIPAPDQINQVTFLFTNIISQLSKSERLWLTEFYQAGKGTKAIANKYSVSTETVKTWRRRAIKKLQRILTE